LAHSPLVEQALFLAGEAGGVEAACRVEQAARLGRARRHERQRGEQEERIDAAECSSPAASWPSRMAAMMSADFRPSAAS
jgi:hypothetical protein